MGMYGKTSCTNPGQNPPIGIPRHLGETGCQANPMPNKIEAPGGGWEAIAGRLDPGTTASKKKWRAPGVDKTIAKNRPKLALSPQ